MRRFLGDIDISHINPIKDWVLLEVKYIPDYYEENGLYVPAVKQFFETAVVRKVGPGRRLKDGTIIKPDVKEGDVVILSNPAACIFIGKKGDSYFGFVKMDLIDAVVSSE